jgi:hypothetical protein
MFHDAIGAAIAVARPDQLDHLASAYWLPHGRPEC